MKRLSIGGLLALVFIFTSCASLRTAPTPDHTAEEAQKLLARGVTMPDLFGQNDGPLWVTYQQLDVFRELAKIGFDAIRIPINLTRAQRMTTAPSAELSEAWLARLERVVRQARRAKLSVVIVARMDADISDPATQQQLIADWSQIAWHFRSADDRVYFELIENFDGELNDAAWSRLAEEIRLAIRLSNPDRFLIVSAAQRYNPARLAHLDLPPDSKLLFAFSYNEPLSFTQQRAVPRGDDTWQGELWNGTEQETRRIEQDLDNATRWASEHNRKLFCSSFSATAEADPESRMRWTAFVARALENRDIAWSYQAFGGPDGIFDCEWRIWRQPLVNILLDK